MFQLKINMVYIVSRFILFILCAVLSIAIYTQLPKIEQHFVNQSVQVTHAGQTIHLTSHEHQIYQKVIKETQDVPIVGHGPVVQEIESIVNMFDKRPERSSIVQPPNGILLFGPPGTGKTTIARSLARRMKCAFLHIEPDFIEDKYCGEGLKNLSAVFSLSKKIKPCVIFFDEIDGFMSTRSSSDQTHTNTMKTTLLTSLDSINTEWDVIFVAATNRKTALDPALLRRLDIQLYMGVPTLQNQSDFFSVYVDLSAEELGEFLSGCPNWTLCDLKNFAKYCLRHYLIDKELVGDKMQITSEELNTKYQQYIQLQYSNDDSQSHAVSSQ